MKSLSKFLPIVTCMLVPLFAYSTAAVSFGDYPDCCVDECTDDPGVDVMELVAQGECMPPPGECLEIEFRQRDLDQLVVGYQAFMCFDPTYIEVCDIQLTPEPYGRHMIVDWNNTLGTINLIAGIDETGDPPQQPTDEDALLGIITIKGVVEGCDQMNPDFENKLCFREHGPPTRFSEPGGDPVYPCLKFTEEIVIDWTDPVIDPEAQKTTIECDGVYQSGFQDWLDDHGGARATDNCTAEEDLDWTYEYEWVDECCETGYAHVTFTVTDDCLNSATTTGTYRIVDTTPPVIDPPAQDVTVECDDTGFQDWLDDHGGARATDVCCCCESDCDPNECTWTYEYEWVDECCDTGYADVTFTVEDDCGNSATTTARFTSEDTLPPVIDPQAQDETVQCDGEGNVAEFQVWLDSHGGAVATDVCCDPNELTWTDDYEPPFPFDCCMAGSVEVTFTVTDDCDNWASTTATFTIEDTQPPVIDPVAEDMTVECDPNDNPGQFQAWLDSHGGAEATDVCCDPNELTWSYEYEWVDECCETGHADVTFTVTDDCLNSATTTARFTIEDTTPPVFDEGTCEPPMIKVFPNVGEYNAYVCLDEPTATDVCCGILDDPNDIIGYRSDGKDLSDPYEIGDTMIWWVATDECGNSDVCTQVVQVEADNLVSVRVEVQGVLLTPVTRCVTFELWNCPSDLPFMRIEEPAMFVPNFDRSIGIVELRVPCTAAPITCMTAQDRLHTTRSTDDDVQILEYTDDFTCEGMVRTKYLAEYVGPRPTWDPGDPNNPHDPNDPDDTECRYPSELGHWLLCGNFDKCNWPDPCEWPECDYWVDILDFGVYWYEFDRGADYGTGDTDCDWPCPWPDDEIYAHADSNGDGLCTVDDFAYFRVNLLCAYEPNCCGAPGALGRGPITRISVAELFERGWGKLAGADLNHDGWLDMEDVEAFDSGDTGKPPVKPSDPSGGSTEAGGVGPVLP